ncbi:hypothetical protein [Streptomyces sp. DSM 15324]|uniref:hypothetical protein n=1 Tax=Streptomyces sp. DSM 15324 TaxID=1739111 RepID=UPI00131A84BC|nr:hypothetical protein [Streptomyces sp. DSM 15324]
MHLEEDRERGREVVRADRADVDVLADLVEVVAGHDELPAPGFLSDADRIDDVQHAADRAVQTEFVDHDHAVQRGRVDDAGRKAVQASARSEPEPDRTTLQWATICMRPGSHPKPTLMVPARRRSRISWANLALGPKTWNSGVGVGWYSARITAMPSAVGNELAALLRRAMPTAATAIGRYGSPSAAVCHPSSSGPPKRTV